MTIDDHEAVVTPPGDVRPPDGGVARGPLADTRREDRSA